MIRYRILYLRVLVTFLLILLAQDRFFTFSTRIFLSSRTMKIILVGCLPMEFLLTRNAAIFYVNLFLFFHGTLVWFKERNN